MKIAATGATGLIGAPLSKILQTRYELVHLKRSPHPTAKDWLGQIDGAHAVINLAGEPIAGKRWTREQKKIIRDSRIETTRAIGDAISQAKNKPSVLVSASAIGFYGARGDEMLDEGSEGGNGFLADLCKDWEAEARRAEAFNVRVVNLRTGIVLARDGGTLAKMTPSFKKFIGGPLGSGKQIISWIHIDDEVGGIIKALEDPLIRGPINLTAPEPVSMKIFAKALGKAMHRPSLFPAPSFILRALLGEMADLIVTGQSVYPKKLLDAGFGFKFGDLESALKDIFSQAV